MADLNQVQLIGRLGQDPEVRFLPNGGAVCNLSVATKETWKDKNTGERKEASEWHRVVVWGKLAEIAGEYCRKGQQVFIQGKLTTRKWQDTNGVEKYTTEIVLQGPSAVLNMLGGKPAEGGQGQQQQQQQQRQPQQQRQQQQPQRQPDPEPQMDFDPDIPF